MTQRPKLAKRRMTSLLHKQSASQEADLCNQRVAPCLYHRKLQISLVAVIYKPSSSDVGQIFSEELLVVKVNPVW